MSSDRSGTAWPACRLMRSASIPGTVPKVLSPEANRGYLFLLRLLDDVAQNTSQTITAAVHRICELRAKKRALNNRGGRQSVFDDECEAVKVDYTKILGDNSLTCWSRSRALQKRANCEPIEMQFGNVLVVVGRRCTWNRMMRGAYARWSPNVDCRTEERLELSWPIPGRCCLSARYEVTNAQMCP